MNGIDFMVRDRGGWLPSVPPPAPFLHPEFAIPTPPPKGEPLGDDHVDYIRSMQGVLGVYDLAAQFGVSRGTISNIWKGRSNAGKRVKR